MSDQSRPLGFFHWGSTCPLSGRKALGFRLASEHQWSKAHLRRPFCWHKVETADIAESNYNIGACWNFSSVKKGTLFVCQVFWRWGANWGHCKPKLIKIKCRLLRRGEEHPGKSPSEHGTEPTNLAVRVWNPGPIGGKQVLSPLRRHCSPTSFDLFITATWQLLTSYAR